jgi:hypothetical protein
VNKKKSLAKSLAIQKERINQVNEKLKDPNLSDRQRTMFESEKKLLLEKNYTKECN